MVGKTTEKKRRPIRGFIIHSKGSIVHKPFHLKEKEQTSKMDNNAAAILCNTVNGGGNECIVDTRAMDQDNKLENEIDEMLDKLEPPPSSECCIYRVHRELRKVNEEAYTPRTVSIGPFHRNNKKLEPMDQVKKRYMKKLVRRSGNLKSCIDFVKNREAEIRDCYSGRFEMDSNEFIKMVLVDSCFIIQFLMSYSNNWEDDDDGHTLSLDLMTLDNISLDLILLENQVPFFVLEGLFSLATSASSNTDSLLDLALYFLDQAPNLQFPKKLKELSPPPKEKFTYFESIKHFTHLVLILFKPLPQKSSPPAPKENFESLHSSMDLTEAGVTFREKRPIEGLFDITFTNEVLEIPRFLLGDATEIQVRNLMALEICQKLDNRCVTDFFVFMDFLINTTRDVDLLVDKKIIINNLGDNEKVADFFNKICINALYDPKNFYFSQICKELNDYCEVPCHKLKAMLKRDYFRTPWQTASTIAAITLLVLTLIQTLCSIISIVNGT